MSPTQILRFERDHPGTSPTKHAEVRRTLGISEIRFYALLERAARSDDGMRADPITARHIRERAERRAAKRLARTA